MTKELLIKFLENQCTPEELDKVLLWIDREALWGKSKDLAYDDWKSFRAERDYEDPQVPFSLLLDKIHHKINISPLAVPKDKKPRFSSQVTAWLTRVAAVLLIAVLSVSIYNISRESIRSTDYTDMVVDSLEVVAPAGSRTVVQLSDGTEVHLNSGSRIKYPPRFNGKNRELTLYGEGFFDVAHDPEHPFLVKVNGLNIKAVGTKFNVLLHPRNEIVATTLVEGRVILEGFAENGKTKIIETLTPGQHVEYHVNSGKVSSSIGDIGKYIAWKDGMLIFDNSGIDEVVDRLGRMFNVEIEASNEIKEYTYTVKFIDESLLQILDLLTRATPVDYVLLPRGKLPDGTYSKQKVLLKKR